MNFKDILKRLLFIPGLISPGAKFFQPAQASIPREETIEAWVVPAVEVLPTVGEKPPIEIELEYYAKEIASSPANTTVPPIKLDIDDERKVLMDHINRRNIVMPYGSAYVNEQRDFPQIRPEMVNQVRTGVMYPIGLEVVNRIRTGEIEYVQQNKDSGVLLDRIWEIFDSYFESDSENPDYASDKEEFALEMFKWFAKFTLNAIAAGVIGNAAYEALKEIFSNLRKGKKHPKDKYYQKLETDFDKLVNHLASAEKKGTAISTRELAALTEMSREQVRSWLKLFGFKHFSNCFWIRVTR